MRVLHPPRTPLGASGLPRSAPRAAHRASPRGARLALAYGGPTVLRTNPGQPNPRELPMSAPSACSSSKSTSLAAPAAHATRRRHVPGGTGATRRRERTRRPSGWFLTRTRARDLAGPRGPSSRCPKRGPRRARVRALKEAPNAVLDAKRGRDKFSAKMWRAKDIVTDIEEELAGLHHFIGETAAHYRVSPFWVYACLYRDRLRRVRA